MKKERRDISLEDIPLSEIENLKDDTKRIVSKHASKHMSFNTSGDGRRDNPVYEREDGVAYDPKTAVFYETRKFREQYLK